MEDLFGKKIYRHLTTMIDMKALTMVLCILVYNMIVVIAAFMLGAVSKG